MIYLIPKWLLKFKENLKMVKPQILNSDQRGQIIYSQHKTKRSLAEHGR